MCYPVFKKLNVSGHTAHLQQLKISDFSGEILKVFWYYDFLWMQRRHNCSAAASYANCVMTLYLVKVYLQTVLSTQKTKNAKFWVVAHLTQMNDMLYNILDIF